MKNAYPVVLSKEGDGYFVTIPDFDINTQGSDIADAMYMARDAIGLMGIDMEDDGKPLPEPGTVKAEKELDDDVITLIDVDFTEYRKKVDNRSVKKNCTIPYWLSVKAEKNSINYSRVLQDALIKTLKETDNILREEHKSIDAGTIFFKICSDQNVSMKDLFAQINKIKPKSMNSKKNHTNKKHISV